MHQLTDACNVKWQAKSDSCLSFQTAKGTGDLPAWLASMLNSSFRLHSAAWITTPAKLPELNWRSSLRGQPRANRCSEHLKFTFTSSDFFTDWTRPDLKAHMENITLKKWKRTRNGKEAIMQLLRVSVPKGSQWTLHGMSERTGFIQNAQDHLLQPFAVTSIGTYVFA